MPDVSNGKDDSQSLNIPGWPEQDLESLSRCPCCDSPNIKVLYSGLTDRVFEIAPGTWTEYQCLQCGSAFLNPRPTRESILNAYKGYYTHQDEPQVSEGSSEGFQPGKMSQTALRNGYLNSKYGSKLTPHSPLGFLVAAIPPLRERAEHFFMHLPAAKGGDRLLEIGCGNGQFLDQMAGVGWSVTAVEFDSGAAEVARRKGHQVIVGQLSAETFPNGSFNAICMHHVIEHLHDPNELMQVCFDLLKPDGVLAIVTPNFDSFGSMIYGDDWYPLDPPRHLVLFTPDSLSQRLRTLGFKTVTTHRSSFGSHSIHQASERLRSEGRASGHPLPWKSRALMKLSPLLAYLSLRSSEEIVLTAIK